MILTCRHTERSLSCVLQLWNVYYINGFHPSLMWARSYQLWKASLNVNEGQSCDCFLLHLSPYVMLLSLPENVYVNY